jgi:hypothetical protein
MRAGKQTGRAARCESENGVLQKLRAAHPFGFGFVGGSAVPASVIVVSRLTLAKTSNWGKQRKRRSEGRLLVVQTLPTARMLAPGNLSKGQSVLPPRVRRQRDLRQIAPGPFFEFPWFCFGAWSASAMIRPALASALWRNCWPVVGPEDRVSGLELGVSAGRREGNGR